MIKKHKGKARDAGQGLSPNPLDYTLAVSDEEARSPELRAVFEADLRGDASIVIEFLEAQGLHWIADYVYRRVVHNRTPAYALSSADLNLKIANDDVTELIHEQGLSKAAALEKVATERGISENSLAAFREGKRGGSRRMQARRPARKARR
jgi:hypothetical protein